MVKFIEVISAIFIDTRGGKTYLDS